MILSIDPGKKGGAALFTDSGKLSKTYQFDLPANPRFPSWQDLDLSLIHI